MDGFIFSIGRIFNYGGDLLLILIPIVVVVILIIVFVMPKNPKIGAGLLAGTGIIGFFLLRSRLKNAFSLEQRISKYHKEMADFKNKQKVRASGVMANKEIISTLENQKDRLKKNEKKYQTELSLIDAEIKDRKLLNEKLLNETDSFIKNSEERSIDRRALAQKVLSQSTVGIIEDEQDSDDNTSGTTMFSIGGYSLKEV